MTRRAIAAAVLCALALPGCALRDPPPRWEGTSQGAPNLVVPERWTSTGTNQDAVSTAWVASFGDRALDALVYEALAYNADLRIAAARIDVAAASVRAASSPLWPQIQFIGRGGGEMGGDASGLQGAGFFASWELDFWGRVRAERAASQQAYESARLDTAYARQSIAALVAKSWVLAVEARLGRQLARDMLVASEQNTALIVERQRVGIGDEYDVALAQANIQSFRDTVRSLDLSYLNALRALESLVGRYPAAEITVATGLPAWPGDVPVGLPADLLERRPDFVAAERRLASAFYRTEEAKAARLPRISLVASFTSVTSELFVLQERSNPLFSMGASLLQPIFFGGLLQAQVDVRTAEQQAAVAEVGKVSIKAFGEVEGALSAGFTAAERELILQRSEAENARALELSRVRFRVGSGDLRAVQQQQLVLYSIQVTRLRMQSERLIQRINLHLALGGGFDDASGATTKTSASGVSAP